MKIWKVISLAKHILVRKCLPFTTSVIITVQKIKENLLQIFLRHFKYQLHTMLYFLNVLPTALLDS